MKPSSADPLGLLFARRSIRHFRPGAVDDAVVTRLLEAAMAAPSAVAKDPWRFVVIRSPATLTSLAEFLSNGQMLLGAGLAIVVGGDLEAAHDRQLSYLLQDCAAAIENLLLAASALGLGACWLGVHPRENRMARLKDLLGLPGSILPVACVALGQPAEVKEPRTRYRREYIHFETW